MEITPLKSVKNAEQAVEYALEAHKTRSRNDPGRVLKLRVSSFPFCATKWWFGLQNSLLGTRESDFMGRFFTDVGTQVHTTVQSILDNSKFVVRDWKCLKCSHRHQFTTKPTVCEGCRAKAPLLVLIGLENAVNAGVISGHIDDAFLLGNGNIDLLDYKTTSVAKITSKSALPNLENVRQIEAYTAIKKKQGEPMQGWTLSYISRNNGSRRYETSTKFYGHSFEVEYPKVLKRLATYVADYKAVAYLTDRNDLPDILSRRRLTETKRDTEGLCQNCGFKSLCPNDKKSLAFANKVFDAMESRLPIVKMPASKTTRKT